MALVYANPGENLTIRRVADAVGSGSMALYRYFPDRDALLHAVADRVTADIAFPRTPGATWQDELRRRMLTNLDSVRPFPHLLPYLASTRRSTWLPAFLLLTELLRPLDLEDEDLAAAVALVGTTIVGLATLAAQEESARESLPHLHNDLAKNDPVRHARVGAALDHLLQDPAGLAATVVTHAIHTIELMAADPVANRRSTAVSPASVDAAIATITADGPLDVLFNNAGVAGTLPAPIVFGVNYLGLRRLTEALAEAGTLRAGGAIVNTASIAGYAWAQRLEEHKALIATAGWDETQAELAARGVQDAYVYSKELVQVYTMHYARTAAAKGLRINSICPSPIDTPLLPDFRKTMGDKVIDWNVEQGNGRLATGHDVALGLAFLGADASGYVNGVNVNVDGGFQASLTVGNVDYAGLR